MNRSTQWTRGALVLAPITLAFLAIGCGSQEQASTSGSASTAHEAVAASSSGPGATSLTPGAGQAVAEPEKIAAITNDSVPPDVAASVVDTLVTPGTIIEVTAQGSPDVEEVLLADGIGKPQRFAYDQAADLWRASYRVPVRFPGDRLGLAVTAKNSLHRWRRVWVFLGVQQEVAKDSVQVEEK